MDWLKDQTVFITGAGQGIGKAVALGIAGMGATARGLQKHGRAGREGHPGGPQAAAGEQRGHALPACSTHKHPKHVEYTMRRAPLKRYGDPAELAGPMAFPGSSLASYITGSAQGMDGGYLIS